MTGAPRRYGLALAAFWLLTGLGCRSALREIPEELRGVWQTSDPRFAERSLDLRADSVAFGTPDPVTFPVESVRVERREGRLDVVIAYRGEEQRLYSLQLRFQADRNELELSHREGVVWRRAGPRAGSAALPTLPTADALSWSVRG